ncbi:hypothetical protein E3N88_37093 [Mikania micrantha]|uniref:Tf2-1-like SH3-like domain-containing protein n=1 Tax=Mikania micrantha TaxID=192012 RepID=A0A5N6M889_9ASTR|nr:hypothetical protein E3N88_37093 [Mikania micrantha]
MAAARDRQKSYVDKRRKPLEFQVGDRVLLKVSPWKGVIRFGKRGKLNPRYIGPFEITKRIGPVAYELNLPVELSSVHNVFHISNLKKCLSDETLVVPLEEIQIDEQLNFVEEPVEIMDRETKKLKLSKIPIVKVRWNSRRGPEFTWEREDQMKQKYPHLSNKAKRKSVNVKTATNGSNPLKWAYWALQGMCRATRRPTRNLSRYATGGRGKFEPEIPRATRETILSMSRYATRPSSQNLYLTKTPSSLATLFRTNRTPGTQDRLPHQKNSIFTLLQPLSSLWKLEVKIGSLKNDVGSSTPSPPLHPCVNQLSRST